VARETLRVEWFDPNTDTYRDAPVVEAVAAIRGHALMRYPVEPAQHTSYGARPAPACVEMIR
jgi:hypothetical protein